MGHPQFIKNNQRSMLGHSRALLSELWHQIITKLMPTWFPRTTKCSKKNLPRPLKNNKAECNHAWNQLWIASMIKCKTSRNQLTSRLDFMCSILIWLQSCKSCKSLQYANYQTAGCQRGRRQGWSLNNNNNIYIYIYIYRERERERS